ncbi:TIR domain-containing protein [Sphingobacteriales bacterium UPWRP_1]|nr:hypothetical protein BVG80_09280 [Sphingobacteriales bacterium TSM_CSM]PSJ78544.1 TIR domain-containing protein [Sphingobacteriales bacterium UPWRP_1]
MSSNGVLKLFIAYAGQDAAYCHQLRQHLAALERMEQVQIWYDGEIVAGQDWETELLNHLQTADIILLLVSPDFIASDFCYETLFPIAIKMHKSQTATVVPVIIRQCIWEETLLGKMKPLPKNGVPPTNPAIWSSPDDGYAHIAHELSLMVNAELQKRGLLPQEEGSVTRPINKFKQGKVLYLVPEQMQVLKKHICLIRIAPEDINPELLKERLKNATDAVIESIRIDSIMKAEIIDDTNGEAFEIDRIGELEQPIEEDNYTEWRYHVTPHKEGVYNLCIKVSILVKVAELSKFVYKDVVVLDRTIQVTTYTIEPQATDWRVANEVLPIQEATDFNITEVKNENEPTGNNRRLLARMLTAILAAVFFVPILSWAFLAEWVTPLYLKLAYDDHRTLQDDRIAVKKNGKWGFVNKWGIESTPTIYDEAYNFTNGIAMVKQNGKEVKLGRDTTQSLLQRMWNPIDFVIPDNLCANINCGAHGTCNPQTGKCNCKDGYTGDRCQTPPPKPDNLCKNINCGAHGTCNPQTGKCNCKDGYTGDRCQTPPPKPDNLCKNINCGVHGTCNPQTGKCNCKDGYTGDRCQTPPPKPDNPCSSINCGAHGTCNPQTGKCNCKDGYTGDRCQTPPQPPDVCAELRCNPVGTASCDAVKRKCICKPGYEGARCQIKTDPCSNVRCPVGKNCVNGQCVCPEGFTGKNCRTPVKCVNVDCGTHGNCNPETGECICKDGYTGNRCQTPPSKCANVVCDPNCPCDPKTGKCDCGID